MLDLVITNKPPETAVLDDVDPALLALFRGAVGVPDAMPYQHQAATFAHVLADREVALVAGTAAGKTFAIALPCLTKVFTLKRVRKLVFIYPTRALLADQRRILNGLVATLDPQETIGEIRGGMTSAQLIRALSQRVIVATPDALFWFFRKNVKFTMALIYGLAQADEIVLDEAHLYTGLMLRNMRHFLDRLRQYRRVYFGESLRVHYLTATANPALSGLSNGATEVYGRSKCTEVALHMRAVAPAERRAGLESTLAEALALGGKRILVVSNSARSAHAVFLTHGKRLSDAEQRAMVPKWFWLRFGQVEVGRVLDWLNTHAPDFKQPIMARILESLAFRTGDLKHAKVWLRAEYLGELASRVIERDMRTLRRVLERYRRQHTDHIELGKLGLMLSKADAGSVADRFRLSLTAYTSITAALEALASSSNAVIEELQGAIDAADQAKPGATHGGIVLTGDVRATLNDLFGQTTLGADLRRHVAARMAPQLILDRETVENWEHVDPALYRMRLIGLGRVLNWIEDEQTRNQAESTLIESAVGHSGIAIAHSLPGDPLLILYSGSMSRFAREGLIETFTTATTDRPVVLLSTSAVEVGVDFAADVLITEECEGSSFLQRLGRIGRRAEIDAIAWVLVETKTLQSIATDCAGETFLERDRFAQILLERFPARMYLRDSQYVNALQLLVTRQLGRTGHLLATDADSATLELAASIAEGGLDLDYGLRGTMPAVSLQDQGVSKDPFYILRFVDDADLLPAATPFEVAALARSFNSLVFQKGRRRIFIHLTKSLERCVAVAVPTAYGPRIMTHSDIVDGDNPAKVYIHARDMIEELGGDLSEADMAEYFPSLPRGASFALDQGLDPLLAYGPLALACSDFDDPDAIRLVEDRDGSAIVLPDQWYLVLQAAISHEQGWDMAEKAGVYGFESEVHYDVDRPISERDPGVVLLDKQAGAVWEIWETLQARGAQA